MIKFNHYIDTIQHLECVRTHKGCHTKYGFVHGTRNTFVRKGITYDVKDGTVTINGKPSDRIKQDNIASIVPTYDGLYIQERDLKVIHKYLWTSTEIQTFNEDSIDGYITSHDNEVTWQQHMTNEIMARAINIIGVNEWSDSEVGKDFAEEGWLMSDHVDIVRKFV